jgi:hypothetical protein
MNNNSIIKFARDMPKSRQNRYATAYTQYLNFKLIWTPDEISVYYNDKLVRQVTDNNILKWFKEGKMSEILLTTRWPAIKPLLCSK